jgi:phosphohistidine phosphatase
VHIQPLSREDAVQVSRYRFSGRLFNKQPVDYTEAIGVKHSLHSQNEASGAVVPDDIDQQQRCFMQVFIMRHGDAALEAASDSARPLTLCGCNESRQMASWLNSQTPDIGKVLVSPYLRAGQTLATVREALDLPQNQDVLSELTPGGDPGQVALHLQALAVQGVKAVLVISHLPLVGYLVSELCPQEAPPMFATSAIACIDFNADECEGKLLWQVSPARLAKAI